MRRWRGLLFRLGVIGALAIVAYWAATRDDIVGRAIVHDGDTITVDGTRIRIFGIDAPELGQTCRDRNRATYDCGRLAQRQMERLTRAEVTCDTVETDQFGRDVAICRAAGTDLGEAMVASGWARAYLSYSLRYAPAESKARTARRGLWDGEFDDPWAFRQDGLKDDLIAFAWRWVMERLF